MKPLEEREQREYERSEIIKKAVEAAYRIILEGSGGSIKETNYLTGKVARKLTEKALYPFDAAMMHKDLE